MVEAKERRLREGVFAERSCRARLAKTARIIKETGLAKTLGITDPVELEYFAATLAWDLSRKEKRELDHLLKHPWGEAVQKMGGLAGTIGRMAASVNEEKARVTALLLEEKEQILRDNPSLDSVAQAIDRASNMLSFILVQRTSRRVPPEQVLLESGNVIARFRDEISQARAKAHSSG